MKFASLFSGCGGFDIGLINEGFTPIAAYDCDQDAVSNYGANIGNEVFNADLTRGIPNQSQLKGIDALIAGPPCQGFSTAGKRRIDDVRNHLVTLTGILAASIKPKVLVVENVAGALSGQHARYWNELTELMQLAGYQTKTIKCQAADLGMAQLRKRILLFAWKTGNCIDFTLPNIPPKNLKEVLSGVSYQKNHKPINLEAFGREWMIASKIKPGQKLSNVRGGDNAVATWDIPEVFGEITPDERTVLELVRRLRRQDRQRDYGDADPVSFPRLESALGNTFHILIESLISKKYLRRVNDDIDLVGTFNGKFRRLAWDKPSCTVDTRFGSPRYFLHPSRQRGFTVREAARIQGFDDSYIFSGNESAQFRLIGNAVPPPLAKYAATIIKRLLGKIA